MDLARRRTGPSMIACNSLHRLTWLKWLDCDHLLPWPDHSAARFASAPKLSGGSPEALWMLCAGSVEA
eukprot:15437938-Alexandrium_andersonii.AAC.1